MAGVEEVGCGTGRTELPAAPGYDRHPPPGTVVAVTLGMSQICPFVVDGSRFAAIMPRSLRARCPSVEPQFDARRQVQAVQWPRLACIIVGLLETLGQAPDFNRSLTIQSDNLCGCLRWSLQRQIRA